MACNNLKIFSTRLLTFCVTTVMYRVYLKIVAVSGKNDGLRIRTIDSGRV